MTPRDRETLFHLPGRSALTERARLAIFFLGFFYLAFGSAALLADYIPYRFHVGFAWEASIPFLPWSAAVYFSLFALMSMAIFVVRGTWAYRYLVQVLCLQVLLASVLFLAFPVATNFPPRYGNGELPWIFVFADTLNLHNNQLPSLHVCFALTIAFVLSQYASERQAGLILVWASLIAVSAITIHEHNIADVAAGILLALWGAAYWRRLTQGVKLENRLRSVDQRRMQTRPAVQTNQPREETE